MKKLIAILTIMVVLVGAVFSASGDKLIVNAEVAQAKPIFLIYGGKTADAASTEGTQAGAEISYTAAEGDISEVDIPVFIKLTQDNLSKFKGTATLTVTGTALVNTDNAITTNNTTAAPAASNHANGTVAGITITNDESTTNQVVYTLTYNGQNVDGATEAKTIGTFKYLWTHNINLAVGTYQATITLIYTPV